MASEAGYRKTTRQTSLHRRPGAMNAADMLQLRRTNTAIPFYLLMAVDGVHDAGEDVDEEGGGEEEAGVF